MPKSAAKAFVSAVSDAMAFLVVDPDSGVVKKLKASAARASTLADGLMSAEDKSKIDGMRNPSRAIVGGADAGRTASTTFAVLDSQVWSEDLDTHGYFTQSTNGRFTYAGVVARTFIARVTGRVKCTAAGNEIRIAVHQNGVDLGIRSNTSAFTVPTGADQYDDISLITVATLQPNDIIDVRMRTFTASGTVTSVLIMELEEVVS